MLPACSGSRRARLRVCVCVKRVFWQVPLQLQLGGAAAKVFVGRHVKGLPLVSPGEMTARPDGPAKDPPDDLCL